MPTTRDLHHLKQPRVLLLNSNPTKELGNNGDIAIASLTSGVYFFIKAKNRWWTSGKLIDTSSGNIEAYDPQAIHSDKSNEIQLVTLKGAPEDDDIAIFEDSSDGYTKKSVPMSAIRESAYQYWVESTQCLADAWALSVMDNIGHLIVPDAYDDWYLIDAQANLATVGSTASVFDIYNVTKSKGMLTTKITVGSGDNDSTAYATQPVMNQSLDADKVSAGDRIRFDCDQAGTGAKGLMIITTWNKQRIV